MEEITICISIDTYDRIVDMLAESGCSDLSVERFVEKLLIKSVHPDENV